MDLDKIVSDLKKERDRVTRAIDALIGSYSPRTAKRAKSGNRKAPKRKGRRRLTAEGRRRLSLAMKKRWAEGKMKRK